MLQKCTIWKTAGIFFQEPMKEHGLLELCRKTGIAHTSVKNHLETLKRMKIISERTEKKGNRNYPVYKAEQANKTFRDYKRLHNLAELMNSGLMGYIKDKLAPKAIALFGSYQKGEDTEDSDIDLFVETEKANIDISKFEKTLKRKIQLHFKDNFKNYSPELKNSIINGTVLEGYLEAF